MKNKTNLETVAHILCLSNKNNQWERVSLVKNKKANPKQGLLIMNKHEQGITIISLVITIIILLILAGVAIRAVSGDNGLFTRSKIAVEESKIAEYKEGIATIGLGVNIKTSIEDFSTEEYIEEYYQELLKDKEKEGSLFKDSNIKKKNDETIRVETKEGYIYYVREDETIYIGKVRRSRRRKYSRIKTRRYII